MKNSVLTQKANVNFNEFKLNPTYAVNIQKVRDFMRNNLSMFYVKEMNDDVRFEVLAFREYNDSSLWDVLMILNFGEYGILNFVKSDDWVDKIIDKDLEEQEKYYTPYYDTKELKEQIKNKITLNNELKRKVIFIKQQFIPQFKEELKGMLNVF